MEAKFTLPPEITQGASARGNEYGWTLDSFPQALLKAQVLGYACLGGPFQFRLDDGTYEMYWLNADSTDRDEGESWVEFVRRSCHEVLGRFNATVASADFSKEASSWPSLATAMAQGLNVVNHLVFVAYFVTESELAGRGFYSVNRPIVTSPKRGATRLKRQVDWLVNGLLTGPIFLRALNQLTQLEIFSARDKDWPVNKRN